MEACARRVIELEPEIACFGHGPPLRDGERFRSFVAGARAGRGRAPSHGRSRREYRRRRAPRRLGSGRHHTAMAAIDRATAQTFLFADVAGFTAMTEVRGDDAAADAAGDFYAGVPALLAEYGAHEVKTVGDALLLRVPPASRAVALALRILG